MEKLEPVVVDVERVKPLSFGKEFIISSAEKEN